jgi:hypothetical protein
VRAALLALVWIDLVVLAPPGLDLVSGLDTLSRKEMWDLQARYGVLAADIALDAVQWNARFREPMLPLFQLPLRPIRGMEGWALFSRGRSSLRRFEVEVDGEVIYRSASESRNWRLSSLRNRHTRPMAESFARGEGEIYREAYENWVLGMVLEDRPDASVVTLRGTKADFPKGKPKVVIEASAEAPTWRWVTK